MGRYSSDSDSETERKRSGKRSKKKSKSRRRSRSSSYDTGRSRDSRRRSRSDSRGRSRSSERRRKSRSRDDRRRRHRSRSEDSYRSRRSHRRSRSKTRSPRRRRSRSRSDSRDDRYSRRHSSRSHSRERSKRSKKSGKRSRSREYASKKEKVTTEKSKDPCENIPGFAEMTPAEQSKLRIQAAFDAVEASTTKAMEGTTSSTQAENTLEQIERSQVLQDIEEDDFIPTHFSSSRSQKSNEAPKPLSAWPKTLAEQEDFHEMAIFGSTKALALDEKVRKEISDAAEPLIKTRIKWEDRDPETLAHDNLKISKEDAERRWVDKLNEMRRQHLIEMGVIQT